MRNHRDDARDSLPADAGFVVPRFDHALDLDALLARVPAHATGKGMFLSRLQAELAERGMSLDGAPTFHAFADYPLAECIRRNVEVARKLHPELPVREGLRRVAWLSFDTFATSMIGAATLAAVQRSPAAIFGIAGRALSYATNVGRYWSEAVGERSAIIHADAVFMLPDCLGVGIAEGVLRACRLSGSVLLRILAPARVDYLVRW